MRLKMLDSLYVQHGRILDNGVCSSLLCVPVMSTLFINVIILNTVILIICDFGDTNSTLVDVLEDRSYNIRGDCQCHGRSYQPPSSARDVKLQDVDIIGAIGDSDTAAFAANSGGLLDYFTEYWGSSFATGTDGNAYNNPTLANLLRMCNPGKQSFRCNRWTMIAGQG